MFLWTYFFTTGLCNLIQRCEPDKRPAINPDDQQNLESAAKEFCDKYAPTKVTAEVPNLPVKKTVKDVYDFKINVWDECEKNGQLERVGEMNAKDPQPEWPCVLMMEYTRDKCESCSSQ